MNRHVQKMKNSLTNYQAAVKAGLAKIEENNRVYKPEAAKEANAAIKEQLKKDLDTVKGFILDAQEAGRHDAEAWGTPDPAKITADAQLLEHDAVTPEQFKGLVKKYQDNSTMLQILANYAEKKNQGVGGFESVWNYGGKGNVARGSNHFDTTGLPTIEAKKAAIDRYAATALNIADQIGSPAYKDGLYTIGAGPESAFVVSALEQFGADAS